MFTDDFFYVLHFSSVFRTAIYIPNEPVRESVGYFFNYSDLLKKVKSKKVDYYGNYVTDQESLFLKKTFSKADLRHYALLHFENHC